MSNRELRDAPKTLHPKGTKVVEEAWCYEEPSGLEVIVPIKDAAFVEYSHITIPWRFIRAALARKDA